MFDEEVVKNVENCFENPRILAFSLGRMALMVSDESYLERVFQM